jgi:hypothetical protein
MTLIAHSIEPPFFAIGDVLMSSRKKIPFVPPVAPIDVSQLLNEEDRIWHPYELRRKVYILKRNLAIAFSGNSHEIKGFLKELRIKCNYYDDGNNEIKLEYLQQIIEEYDFDNMFTMSSFFMMHINDIELTAVVITKGHWDSIDNKTYHEMFANGSGSDGYLYWLNENIKTISSHPEGDVNRLIQMNCAFIAKLFAIERHGHATLRDNWGAGFELIFHTGQSFIKYEEIAYIIFEAKFSTEGDIELPFPVNIMYYKYQEEILTITSIDVYSATTEKKDDNTIIITQDLDVRVYPVLPLDIDENTIDKNAYAKDVSFTTYCVARGLVLNKDGFIHSIPSFFNRGSEIKVEYNQGENKLEIPMHNILVEEMKSLAKELFFSI